jgi:hypothetical protein
MTLPMVFADADPNSKPWPEEVVEALGGHMTVLVVDGKRLYCVRDWVYVVSGSVAVQRHKPYTDLKAALRKRGESRFVENFDASRSGQSYYILIERPNPDAQNKKMAFADDVGLYELTIRMDDKSEAVRAAKTRMAGSASFMDNALRYPGAAKDFFAKKEAEQVDAFKTREYYALLRDGFNDMEARQMIETRADMREMYKEISAEWHARGAEVPKDYATLRNVWSMVLNGKTATQIRKEIGLPARNSLWDFDSPMELARNRVMATLAKGLHIKHNSKGTDELAQDIRETKPAMDALTDAIENMFSNKRRSLPEPKPEQLKLTASRGKKGNNCE